ncbi:hypothetical protein ACI65C_006466 [Semiaphis heraclei]
MPLSINFQIDTHIKSFPARESHYSRKDNNGVIYLSPDLNISKMYNMYLEKHEPGYLVANRQDQTVQPIVKYAYFANRFSTNFNIHFSNPRSDTCQKCDQLQNMIKSETNEDAINELKLEKEIHIRKAEVFYTDMKRFSTEAKLKDSVELLSFDYQQNMALPYVPAGDVFYKRQLWSYNFCIHSAKTKKSYFFMYDESTAKKGQNEVISFLNYYFLNILSPDVNMVYLFSDNCSAQNKNKLLFAYLSALVNTPTNNIKHIVHRYPEPGHSFLACDRCFGHIEKLRRKVERVYLPTEYEKMVKDTNKNYNVIHVTQDMIYNYNDYLTPLCKKIITNTNKVKFLIMSYRYVEYKSEGIYCSISGNSTAKELYSLEKVGSKLLLDQRFLHELYNGPIQLKQAKYNDVQQLAAKYVPNEHQWFYNNLQVLDTPNEQLSDSE